MVCYGYFIYLFIFLINFIIYAKMTSFSLDDEVKDKWICYIEKASHLALV